MPTLRPLLLASLLLATGAASTSWAQNAAGRATRPAAKARPALSRDALAKRIESRKLRARKLITAKKYREALLEISRGKVEIRETRQESRNNLSPQADPAYRREMKALGDWWAKQSQLVRQKKVSPEQATRELSRRREALAAKFKTAPKPDPTLKPKRDQAEAAALLLSAELDDLAAEAYQGDGQPDAATASRITAARERVQAHRMRKDNKALLAAADVLLKVADRDPTATAEAAAVWEGQKQWEKAANAYRTSTELWETGRARRYGRSNKPLVPREHAIEVALRYRQLAFSLSQLKRGTEAKAALAKAEEWERQTTQPRRSGSR